MNILYINHYAGSISMGMEFRPYYLAKEWMKLGHKVRIIGADYSHLRKKNPVVSKNFEIQEIDGVEYQWIKTREYEGNGLKRAITMEQFCQALYLSASKLAKEFEPDIVIASSTYPLDSYPARRIANKAGAKLVHEVHDMWPITPIELYGMSKTHPFVVIMQMGENYFCKKADKVISVLPDAKDYLVEHGMKPENFAAVTNGINLEDWEKLAPLPSHIQDKLDAAKKDGRLVIGFFGSHTRSYSLDYLLEAAKEVGEDKLYLAFVGGGNYKEELKANAKALGLAEDSYCFFDPIDKTEIPALIGACDVSYVGALKNKMFRFGIGMNKLFDAMMGGKPILYAVEAPNNYIKEFDCGISVEAEDTKALADGIRQMLELTDERRDEMGANGRKAVLENFNFEVLAKKFIEEVEG